MISSNLVFLALLAVHVSSTNVDDNNSRVGDTPFVFSPVSGPMWTPEKPPAKPPARTPHVRPPVVSPFCPPTLSPTAAPTVTTTTAVPSELQSVSPSDLQSDVPSGAPTLIISSNPMQTVRVPQYYLAFAAPDATREPTQEEYDEVVRCITAYFEEVFTSTYALDTDTEFLDLLSSNDFSLYGAGIPAKRFNIYMHFEFSDFFFSEESVVPSSSDIFLRMQFAIMTHDIPEIVRTYSGTPFESVYAVLLLAD